MLTEAEQCAKVEATISKAVDEIKSEACCDAVCVMLYEEANRRIGVDVAAYRASPEGRRGSNNAD